MSSQVKYIYIALFTIQIVSKLLHNINQDNLTVHVNVANVIARSVCAIYHFMTEQDTSSFSHSNYQEN